MGLSPEFYKKLVQVSTNVGMKPEDILNVMAVESGLNPAAHNANGGASGLVQFMPSTLKHMGFKGKPQDFRDLGAVGQLDWIEKLIKYQMKVNGGPFSSAAQYYVGNFIPVALKIPGVKQKNPNTIICSKNPTTPHIPNVSLKQEASFYKANPGLDFDKDGHITYGDIEKVLKSKSSGKTFQSAVSDLTNYTGYKPMSNQSTKPKSQDLGSILNNFLKLIAASEVDYNKLYKKYLPYHTSVIQINGNFTDSLEFAQVACGVLSEELLAKAYPHTNGKLVEIECSIPGPAVECIKVANELLREVQEVFCKKAKTDLKYEVIPNTKSIYEPVHFKVAEAEHRKFTLKMQG